MSSGRIKDGDASATDLPGHNADRKGENDRSPITSDNKTRPLNQAPIVRSSFS